MNAGGVAPGRALSALLFAPGMLYAGAIRMRNLLYDARVLPVRQLACATIGIGNLTVGGTGKTPLTSFAAAGLAEAGYRVGVVSRGYRRLSGDRALLVSDGRSLLADADQAGDEPYLIARDNPSAGVAVGADRAAAARLLAAACAPEVILLDDAFQHRAVARDLDLLLVDGKDPWGNGRMLPFGPLREPLGALSRASALVITRGDGTCPAAVRQVVEQHNPAVPVFHGRIAPRRFIGPDGHPVDLSALKGFGAYAFSGIARPERFEEDLRALGLRLLGSRRFPDHHPFLPGDLGSLRESARGLGAEVLVTTEKDLVRLPAGGEPGPPLFSLAIAISFPARADLTSFLLDRLGRIPARRATGARP